MNSKPLHPLQQTYLFILKIFYADFASSEIKNPNSNALCVGWKTTFMPKTAMISLAATGPRTKSASVRNLFHANKVISSQSSPWHSQEQQ